MELSHEEIEFFIKGYVNGSIMDYQISALLMAICINGMTDNETLSLTKCMIESGETIDLSSIPGIKVDKHSTGGVGDKTTLVVSPIVAACGIPVAKMSGRGLGYTGGTIDKLESIPGMKTSLDKQTFFNIIKRTGFSITGQSGNIVPADKKLYALRDVTCTVESIPLIASSIMSKKLALGSDCILLDVKTGSGAFMKDFDSSIRLAETMVKIGKRANKETIAVITDMSSPLGNAIGNSLEVIEAIDVLKGKGSEDIKKICIYLSANMLYLAGIGSISKCKEMAYNAIENGSALKKLKDMIEAQNGDSSVLEDYNKLGKAKFSKDIISDKEGYINSLDAEKCGIASVVLGAGREQKNSKIDFTAGIVLRYKVGDYVKSGDILAKIYSSSMEKCLEAEKILKDAIDINLVKLPKPTLIQARITSEGIEKFI